jgi:hypothetical protein
MDLEVVTILDGMFSWVSLLVDLHVKGEAVPVLIKAPYHEIHEVVEVQIHIFLKRQKGKV